MRARQGARESHHVRLEEIRTELDYETIPTRKLVAIQARAGLLCLNHRQRDLEA